MHARHQVDGNEKLFATLTAQRARDGMASVKRATCQSTNMPDSLSASPNPAKGQRTTTTLIDGAHEANCSQMAWWCTAAKAHSSSSRSPGRVLSTGLARSRIKLAAPSAPREFDSLEHSESV
jgi:hypothetical protein